MFCTLRYNCVDMVSVLAAIAGVLAGVMVNWLADRLPTRLSPRLPIRHRPIWTGIGTMLLFVLTSLFITEPVAFVFTCFYVTILVLVIVIDLEQRLILHLVTFPTTLFAILGSELIPDRSWRLAIVGAACGFLLFLLFFFVGKKLFGEGALGFGDVTLSMMLGAMLGLDRIFFALLLGVLLGGVVSLGIVLWRRRDGMGMYIAYGPFLATAGIFVLIWGRQISQWYFR